MYKKIQLKSYFLQNALKTFIFGLAVYSQHQIEAGQERHT
jgi:hypothetical protein